jgi:hypothetical protein
MYVIPREMLVEVLLGDRINPDHAFDQEMRDFGEAISSVLRPDITHLVFSDSENGSDPDISHDNFNDTGEDRHPSEDLLYRTSDNGYYGITILASRFNEDAVRIFHCYMGGSSLQSAPGFRLVEARLRTA